jgi:two-component system, OmpR family, sensor histidine kinase VicK
LTIDRKTKVDGKEEEKEESIAVLEEEGEGEEKTELLYGVENTISRGIQFMQNAKEHMDLFGEKNGPSIIIEFPDVYKNNYIAAKDRGVKIRFITEITEDNIHYCKELMNIVTEFRHLDGLAGGIAVTESEYMTTTTLRKKELLTQVFYSNASEVVKQGQYIFDTFWNKAIPAKQRIREIEQGLEPEFFEVITDNKKATEILVDLAKLAKKEVLFLLPNDRALIRMDRLGVIDYLIGSSLKNGAQVKIVCPLSSDNEEIVDRMSTSAPNINILNGNNTGYGILIVDNKRFLRAELREPFATEFFDAIGYTIYSNSKPSVESFKSIFELLWDERTLNEELKRAYKMQKEFINIAAHELRNPIQPILSISEVLRGMIRDSQQRELLDVTVRNAKRLRQLTEDILDITRIESNLLQLKRERFSLNDMIINCISDFRNQIKNENRDSNLKLEASFSLDEDAYKKDDDKDDILIEADRNRLYQVLSNLLNNAIKFTKEGTISVSVMTKRRKGKKKEKENSYNEIIVSISDTGPGIDPEIFPRLFSKFSTKSETGGTGLGLYISKSIIEAHGGKMWAENNNHNNNNLTGVEKRGTTITFTLPNR